MPDAGGLLLIEPVLPEVVEPDALPGLYLTDLNMLVNVGGRERTPDDFERLCSTSGFDLASVETLFPPPHNVAAVVANPTA